MTIRHVISGLIAAALIVGLILMPSASETRERETPCIAYEGNPETGDWTWTECD